MTRINCGIPPAELSDKHLLAEHREIKRIPNCIKSGRYSLEGQPKEFTLGKGHVKFFYTRIGYLKSRYWEIYLECKKRLFKIQFFGDAFEDIPEEFMGKYTPTERDKALIRERIKQKAKNDNN